MAFAATTTKFDKQLRDNFKTDVKDQLNKFIGFAVIGALKQLERTWPQFTGFSAANFRVNFAGQAVGRLDPSIRPETQAGFVIKNSLLGEAKANFGVQIDRVQMRLKGDEFIRNGVTIANAVPYAEVLEFSKRGISGKTLLDNAMRTGIIVANSKIKIGARI